MNHKSIVAFAFAGTTLIAGCTASVDGQGRRETTNTSPESLTVTQCATQRDACFANNPFWGLFTCPAQYNKCVLTASNGLPAQINQAISDAAACNSSNLTCTNAATTPDQLLACGKTNAECVASIFQIHLPTVVTGTATCVADSVKCINAAEQVSDLTTCANNLQNCAVGKIQAVVPEQVGTVIGQVNTCDTTLNSCIAAATTPAELTACSQTAASCVANTLGVALANLATSIVKCSQTAGDCVLDASTPSDVATCTSALTSCVAAATGTTVPPALTCAEKWNACLAKNPFNFVQCDLDLLTCKN